MAESQQRSGTAAPSPVRILIVDDEAMLMKALCDTLREHDYETVGFTSGHAALAALRETKFELLLSDLMMPEIDGLAVLRAAIAIDPDLVGIIMTGQGTIDTAVEAMKTGALDYILKPFRLSVVLPVLSRALTVRRLRLQNAELERCVRQRTVELEATNKELEAFSYSVSHDLRAPLRAIEGFSNQLQTAFGAQMPPDARQLTEKVMANAQRMGQLIEDLLRLSRLGRQALSRQPVSLTALVQDTIAELRKEPGNAAIEVRVSELTDCLGDRSLLEQVLVNLLSNAFKFTRKAASGMIEVGCRQQAGETVYFVRDNGAGFDMNYADKLFGVFQRLHTSEDFDGSGVGLSIVQRIIHRHGGRVWAESAVGQGATFYFTVPESASV